MPRYELFVFLFPLYTPTTLFFQAAVTSVSFSENGIRLATGGADSQVSLRFNFCLKIKGSYICCC